jgi:hypothetical protein
VSSGKLCISLKDATARVGVGVANLTIRISAERQAGRSIGGLG